MKERRVSVFLLKKKPCQATATTHGGLWEAPAPNPQNIRNIKECFAHGIDVKIMIYKKFRDHFKAFVGARLFNIVDFVGNQVTGTLERNSMGF